MKPQKKGFCSKSAVIPQLKSVAQRFMEHCNNYRDSFASYTHNVSDKARDYLAGLLMKAPRKNIERIEEYVEGCKYDDVQQFISDSVWDHLALNERISRDVNSLLGGPDSTLCIDESCFTKKGKDSAGVSPQYNGRLGKIDNCQVGVFTSLCKGSNSSIIDYRLFLPKNWIEDEARCKKSKIPEAYRKFKTKPELAFEMVEAAMKNGVSFGWVAVDALYGRNLKFVYSLDDNDIPFVGDIPCDHTVYLKDPMPFMPRRRNKIGPMYTKLRSRTDGFRADSLLSQISDTEWKKVKVRDTTKGKLFVNAYRRRVYIWDGVEKQARNWWLVVTKESQTNEIKYFLSNAKKSVRLSELVRRHAARFWIERTFQDGKTSVGMADYQVRRWKGWHHHMSMVMLALLFLLKERIHNKKKVELLSCQDIVELLNYYLPQKDVTEEAVFKSMQERHRKRQNSIKSAYKRQKLVEITLPK